MFKNYKNWKATFQSTAKDENSSIVKHILEFEKLKEDVPVPNVYLDFMVAVTKDIEAHLV